MSHQGATYPKRREALAQGHLLEVLRRQAAKRTETGDHPLALGRFYPPYLNPLTQVEVQAIRVAIERRRG
jgi:hypothetical protein